MPGSEQDMHHGPAPTVWRHGGTLSKLLSTCKKLSHLSRRTGMWSNLFFYWLIRHPHMTQQAWPQQFGRELRLPNDLLFGALPDKERPTIDNAADLLDHLHDITMATNTRSWPVTGWKLGTIYEPTGGLVRGCGPVVQPARKGNRPNSKPLGMSHTKLSTEWKMWIQDSKEP
jgi:hypothetical protein